MMAGFGMFGILGGILMLTFTVATVATGVLVVFGIAWLVRIATQGVQPGSAPGLCPRYNPGASKYAIVVAGLFSRIGSTAPIAALPWRNAEMFAGRRRSLSKGRLLRLSGNEPSGWRNIGSVYGLVMLGEHGIAL